MRIALFAAAIAIGVAACSSKNGGSQGSNAGPGATNTPLTSVAGTAAFRTPGPHAPPEVAIADIAFNRLGGSQSSIQVTQVSIVGNYGLALVQIGASTSETLFDKENGKWRPLASNAYVPGGRGLLRFGISQELAHQLDAGLRPVPQQ